MVHEVMWDKVEKGFGDTYLKIKNCTI